MRATPGIPPICRGCLLALLGSPRPAPDGHSLPPPGSTVRRCAPAPRLRSRSSLPPSPGTPSAARCSGPCTASPPSPCTATSPRACASRCAHPARAGPPGLALGPRSPRASHSRSCRCLPLCAHVSPRPLKTPVWGDRTPLQGAGKEPSKPLEKEEGPDRQTASPRREDPAEGGTDSTHVGRGLPTPGHHHIMTNLGGVSRAPATSPGG